MITMPEDRTARPASQRPHLERLPVTLTAEERRLKGIDLASKEREYEREKEGQKAAQKAAKDRLDLMRVDIMDLARVVETGEEDRQVECWWQPDYERSVVKLVRSDTLEIVRTEPMKLSDRQLRMLDGDDDQAVDAGEVDGATDGEGEAPEAESAS